MAEISDLKETDAENTSLGSYSLDGNVANMSTMDDVLQAILGMLKRWFKSSLFRLRDSTDQTKLLAFDLSGITTATTRTLTVQDTNGTLALLNRSQTWSGAQTFTGNLLQSSGYFRNQDGGTAASPSIQPGNDGDTGFYSIAANRLGIATAGVKALEINAAAQLLGVNGSAGTPTYSFDSNQSTGMFYDSGVAFSTGGNLVLRLQNDGDIQAPGAYTKTTGTAANMYVDSAGVFYRSTSAMKYKENLEPITEEQKTAWLALEPFSYTHKGDGSGSRFLGFSADEAHEKGLKEQVVYSDNGEPEGYNYGRDMAIAQAVIRDLIARVEKLEGK